MKAVLASVSLALLLTMSAAAQGTGILRITVVLADADGTATPIPRVSLLISDNPASTAPRLVRTGPDGTIEVTLRPGNYTVESDQPVALGGQAYAWTEIIDVKAGSKAVLALTARNATIEAAAPSAPGAAVTTPGAPMEADSATTFNRWHGSVAQIWTPTAHATGFLIHEKGLIATDYRAIGESTSVTVQIEGVKVAGRVVAAERLQGVAVIWIHPGAVESKKPVPMGCDGAGNEPPHYDDRVLTIAAPMLAPVERVLGTVGRSESQVFEVDWRIDGGSAGGPVFTVDDGRAVGITIADGEPSRSGRRQESQVIPISNACSVLAAAEKKIAGATPPSNARLPIERAVVASDAPKPPDPGAPRKQVPKIAASSFDLALMTPEMARDLPAMTASNDFGNWTEYVANAPPVLLVRITPQFEESLWKTIARGAASTQGVALPPLKSFSANFSRMRAYCDNKEVAPIQPLIIERRVAEKASIREGLYVYSLDSFSSCAAVRFDLFSEKSGDKADTRAIDAKLFAQFGLTPG
jgi:hypothetical protein